MHADSHLNVSKISIQVLFFFQLTEQQLVPDWFLQFFEKIGHPIIFMIFYAQENTITHLNFWE